MSRGAEKTRVPLLMRDRSFYHTFLILAGTLILEQAVVLSVNLADNLMIGSYNETALAAVAAVNQIVFVVQQVIYGVTNGVIVLSSQYWGKQQTAPIRRLVCLGLRLEAALSMLFFAVVSLWPAQCVGLFVTDAAIIAEGVRYLRVIRFTFPFFAVTTVLLGAMRSVETVSLALKVSVVSLVTNCVINYILIFGRFGAPELGVVGAAIGTLAARALERGACTEAFVAFSAAVAVCRYAARPADRQTYALARDAYLGIVGRMKPAARMKWRTQRVLHGVGPVGQVP